MRLILLSGGIDSALCLHRYGAGLAIGFDYGQPHLIELRYARKIAAERGTHFEVWTLPRLPRVDDVVFAGRNAAMLSVAAAIAQARRFDRVVIGCNASDAARFPDCDRPFLDAMSRALESAYGVTIEAPLLDLTKVQIIALAREARLPDTWTCYEPRGETPCGECYACKSLL